VSPTTSQFVQFVPGISFPTPKARPQRSAPNRRARHATRYAWLRRPADIFRNPQPSSASLNRPRIITRALFDLALANCRRDFAVMACTSNSAFTSISPPGAIQGIMDLAAKHPQLLDDPASSSRSASRSTSPPSHHRRSGQARTHKPARAPTTRCSIIIAALLRKSIRDGPSGRNGKNGAAN